MAHTLVRTCRPRKPELGYTRQSCCPELTRAFQKEAELKRDLHWFNWQLRTTTFHVKNYRNHQTQWFRIIRQMWSKYRVHYIAITSNILSYLPSYELPCIERLRFGCYDRLDYESMDMSRVCRMMTEKLVSLGYPRVECDPSEMDVYLSYYSSSIDGPMDMDFFRHLYCMLQAKQVEHKWRIIYSHMMKKGWSSSCYNYKEGYLNTMYSCERADHYFKVWLEHTYLKGEPLALVKAWFSRMKHPSIRV
jgi:hypothetical protein